MPTENLFAAPAAQMPTENLFAAPVARRSGARRAAQASFLLLLSVESVLSSHEPQSCPPK